MALRMQSLGGGLVRVQPARERTRETRLYAASVGRVGPQHRGRAGETRPGAGLSFGGILKGALSVGGAILTGGTSAGIAAGVAALAGSGRSSPSVPARSFTTPSPCPAGYERDPASGQCRETGLAGRIQRYIPGGQVGTIADDAGEAVMGAFGVPALVPVQAGVVQRKDGTMSPILRCIPGMVLGKDNLCYPKGVLGRRSKWRKHRAPTRPPVTSADARHIRKAEAAASRAKKLAQDVGFKVTKK